MGLEHFLRGFPLLLRPGVRLWAFCPLLLNIVLFIGLTLLALREFQDLMAWSLGLIPGWLEFLTWIAWTLFAALLLISYAFTFTLVGNLLAAPFYGLLAEAVYRQLGGSLEDVNLLDPRQMLAIASRALRRELRKLAYFLPRLLGVALLCLLLSWIPLINLLVPLIAFAWGAWSMALQYLDYPADIAEVSFDCLRQQAGDARLRSLGFGGSVLIAASIPLFNIIAMPAAVAGGTSLWLAAFDQAPTQQPASNPGGR